MTEAVFQRIVQHGCSDVEEGLYPLPCTSASAASYSCAWRALVHGSDDRHLASGAGWDRRRAPTRVWMPAVPFKANAKCRHHIPKQKRRLTNRPAYEERSAPARQSDGVVHRGGDRRLAC